MLMTSNLQGEPTTVLNRRMFEPPEWQWTQTGDVGWWVASHGANRCSAPTASGWTSGGQGRLTTVKTGPHRVVYRVDLPEGTVYVKHFLVPDYRAMVRQWFRRGKGRNEGKRSELLAAIGVRPSRRSRWASSGSGSSSSRTT